MPLPRPANRPHLAIPLRWLPLHPERRSKLDTAMALHSSVFPVRFFVFLFFLLFFSFSSSIEFRLLLRLRMSAADAVTSARIEMASVPLINRENCSRLVGGGTVYSLVMC